MAGSQNLVNNDLKKDFEIHVTVKSTMRDNRKIDRENTNFPVLCFDLENVIACPRAEISYFFIKES